MWYIVLFGIVGSILVSPAVGAQKGSGSGGAGFTCSTDFGTCSCDGSYEDCKAMEKNCKDGKVNCRIIEGTTIEICTCPMARKHKAPSRDLLGPSPSMGQ